MKRISGKATPAEIVRVIYMNETENCHDKITQIKDSSGEWWNFKIERVAK